MILARATIETPIGAMYALASPTSLCALEFDGPARHHRLERRLHRWFPPHEIEERDSTVLDQTRAWLLRYFEGATADITQLPIEMHGAEFEQRVWRALLDIRQDTRAATATSRGILATCGRREPSASRTGRTRSRSSCRATA